MTYDNDTTPNSSTKPSLNTDVNNELMERLARLQSSVTDVVDAVGQNHSMLSRIATFWYHVPLWQKIIAGLILIVPVLTIGIVAQLAVFITLGSLFLVLYPLCSWLLDNHHDGAKQIKDTIKPFVDALSTLITEINGYCDTLREGVSAFKKENVLLAENVGSLEDAIKKLHHEVQRLSAINTSLHATQKEMEGVASTLNDSISEHRDLLKDAETNLKKALADRARHERLFEEKIAALEELNVSLHEELTQVQAVSLLFKATSEQFASLLITDKTTRDDFQKRLEDFLNDKEATLDRIIDRIGEAEWQLDAVRAELARANERYNLLLNQQEIQIKRLEEINRSDVDASGIKIQQKSAAFRARFYSPKQHPAGDIISTVQPLCIAV